MTATGRIIATRDRLAKASLLVLLGATGCTVGPKYVRPQIQPPPAFRAVDNAQTSNDTKDSLGDQQWSDIFREPELQDVIRAALANNFDLRIAAERVLEARAQVQITRSQAFPQITVGGTGLGANLGNSLNNIVESPLADGSLSLSTSWTPDFWGLYRRQTEAAREQMMAQVWAQRAVRVSLVQQVATTYIQLRALDRQLEITRRTVEARRNSADLTRRLEEAGDAPLSDVRQAEQLLYTATTQIPEIEQQIQQNENAMRLLLAQEPGVVLHTAPHALSPPPEKLPTGVPSELLERRPDIQQAEAKLRAANAQVGVAKAQFFPQVSISASGGVGGDTLSSLFNPSARTIYGIGSLTQPLFEGGRLRGQLTLSQRQKDEMVANYLKTIYTAFRDVSNALIAARKQRDAREQQELLVAAAEDATRLARARYASGATSYLEVLTTDSNLFSAQLNLTTIQQIEALTLVNLYGALGGGWR
ncbi:efflux transporter outer membrane subunit [Acidicapsa ligni]|uniref:efflux transporter outer membrane subunit n=1 Tax=Acidicapsa ligni TaxID=542300 RepID=UPI0021E02E1B|nr:efflux transporter outer membrane subunit [Acidicapsa ligni]